MRGGGPIDPRPSPLRANSPLIVDGDHPNTSKSSGSTHPSTTVCDFFSLTEGRPNALARRARGAEVPHRPGSSSQPGLAVGTGGGKSISHELTGLAGLARDPTTPGRHRSPNDFRATGRPASNVYDGESQV